MKQWTVTDDVIFKISWKAYQFLFGNMLRLPIFAVKFIFRHSCFKQNHEFLMSLIWNGNIAKAIEDSSLSDICSKMLALFLHTHKSSVHDLFCLQWNHTIKMQIYDILHPNLPTDQLIIYFDIQVARLFVAIVFSIFTKLKSNNRPLNITYINTSFFYSLFTYIPLLISPT